MDFLPTDSCQLVSSSCSVNKHSAVFFSALMTKYKMDAKPQLNTSCVIQAFPGKRALLLSASRQKKKAKRESWAGAEAESRGFMPSVIFQQTLELLQAGGQVGFQLQVLNWRAQLQCESGDSTSKHLWKKLHKAPPKPVVLPAAMW